MNRWTRLGLLVGTLLVAVGTCEASIQEQLAAFSGDFLRQAAAAYLL